MDNLIEFKWKGTRWLVKSFAECGRLLPPCPFQETVKEIRNSLKCTRLEIDLITIKLDLEIDLLQKSARSKRESRPKYKIGGKEGAL